jgi:hypothetical protein
VLHTLPDGDAAMMQKRCGWNTGEMRKRQARMDKGEEERI